MEIITVWKSKCKLLQLLLLIASKLTGVIATKEYKGYSLEIPADEIYLTLDGNKIDVDSNFTRTFGENLNIGEGTVTLTPKNSNFTGSKTLTFQICGEMLKNPKQKAVLTLLIRMDSQ